LANGLEKFIDRSAKACFGATLKWLFFLRNYWDWPSHCCGHLKEGGFQPKPI